MGKRSSSRIAPAQGDAPKVPSGDEQLEHAACCRIISRLAELGPGLAGPQSLPRSIELVRQNLRAVRRAELEGIMRAEKGYNTLDANAFVYGQPLPRGTPLLWPVLAFSANHASRDLKIRVALFYSLVDSSGDEIPGAVGWRFEPPEDDSGSHSYYHVQPISSFDKGGRWRLPIANVLNTSYPAFPLMARGPLGLLTAVLVSLYGRVTAQAMLSDSQLRPYIAPVKEKLAPWL